MCSAMDDQLTMDDMSIITEYVESDMIANSEASVISTFEIGISDITDDSNISIIDEALFENNDEDINKFRRNLEIDIQRNPLSSEIKINSVKNNDGNWKYFYQIYDDKGRELLKSSDLLSVSAYRNEIYKETINEMVKENFKYITIADE